VESEVTASRWSTNRVLAFIVLPAVLLANLLCALGPAPAEPPTAVGEAKRFLLLDGHDKHDSWGPMQRALAELKQHPEDSLYGRLFFTQKIKFQYPPSSLLPIKAVMQLPEVLVRGYRALNGISLLAVWFTIALCGPILLRAGRAAGPQNVGDKRVTLVLTAILALLFQPLVRAYNLGQIQAWLNALFALAVLFWLTDRQHLAGVAVGLICVIKPQLLLFVAWGALRRRWRFVGACLAVLLGVGALSVVTFGWRNHLEYLTVLSFIGRRGEGFFPNQSINGLLNRLLGGPGSAEWNPYGFPVYNAIVHRGTIVTSGLLVVAALFWRRREHAAASTVDFVIAGLTFTMASPVAWEHHFGVLAPIFALTFPLFRAHRPLGVLTPPLLLGCFIAASASIPAARLLPWSPIAIVLQSNLFVAALFFLALLFRLRGAIAVPSPARIKDAERATAAATEDAHTSFEPRLIESGGWD
jgi:alpha-1,2-mannosyltransferase